jgi:hypothetical protein
MLGRMKKVFSWILPLVALLAGAFAWWVDARNDEPQAAVLVILFFTVGLGALRPARAWLSALLVGACLPLGYLVASSTGYLPVSPVEPGWYASTLALLPAFIGAYTGAVLHVTVQSLVVKSGVSPKE